MTKEDLLSEDVIGEAFTIEDTIKRKVLLANMGDRAAQLKCAKGFNSILKAFNDELDAAKKQEKENIIRARGTVDGITNFTGISTQLKCGKWIAGDSGIFARNPNPYFEDHLACYHPIFPVGRMRNLQTGEEQIKLRYRGRSESEWREITIAKSVVASQQKIIALSDYGISVNSENAKWLVTYLSDMENLNSDIIRLSYSSSKLGWVSSGSRQCFVPYLADKIEFDGNVRFRQLYGSIRSCGDTDEWLTYMRRLRASGRLEIKIMIAASLASVLIGPCGTLPFIVDLWGDTEGGKTVTLMVHMGRPGKQRLYRRLQNDRYSAGSKGRHA